MNKVEAKTILARALAAYADRPYRQLVALVDNPEVIEAIGDSGTKYQIEFSVFYDSQTGGDLRVMGSIDDGGWRAFVPLTDSLIKKPGDSCV